MAQAAKKSKLDKLTKKSHLAAGVVLAGTSVLAMGQAEAALIITPLNETANAGEQFAFDLNGDMIDDFVIAVGDDPSQNQPFLLQALEDEPFVKVPNGAAVIQSINDNAKVFEAAPTNFAVKLQPGEQVDGSTGTLDNRSLLYTSKFVFIDDVITLVGQEGPFSQIGDNGYLGLAIFTDMEDSPEPLVNYGWIEITRGSVNGIRIGFQTTPGAPAPIPPVIVPVPEPATLPLMALGAAGLMAMRRRKAV